MVLKVTYAAFTGNSETLSLKNATARVCTHHVVYILPVVEGNELERCQHGPHEVIEVGVAVVRILAHLQTEELRRAVPAIYKSKHVHDTITNKC